METIKTRVISYYHDVCAAEGIKPLPVKFQRLKRLACVVYETRTKKPLNICIDINQCNDLEYALLHETAHQILLLRSGDPAPKHNSRFRALEAKLVDKYMYSKISFKYKL